MQHRSATSGASDPPIDSDNLVNWVYPAPRPELQQWFAETNVRDRYDYLYSEYELEPWKERIKEISGKVAATYVVANNHNLGKAAVNASTVRK